MTEPLDLFAKVRGQIADAFTKHPDGGLFTDAEFVRTVRELKELDGQEVTALDGDTKALSKNNFYTFMRLNFVPCYNQ